MPTSSTSDVTAASTPSSTFGGRLAWAIAAAVVLIVGYVDLWRGGETLAPILLVLGYCVLIPIAILKR
jgi:hypothetical protein